MPRHKKREEKMKKEESSSDSSSSDEEGSSSSSSSEEEQMERGKMRERDIGLGRFSVTVDKTYVSGDVMPVSSMEKMPKEESLASIIGQVQFAEAKSSGIAITDHPAPVQTSPSEVKAIPAPIQTPPSEAKAPVPVQASPSETKAPVVVQSSPSEAKSCPPPTENVFSETHERSVLARNVTLATAMQAEKAVVNNCLKVHVFKVALFQNLKNLDDGEKSVTFDIGSKASDIFSYSKVVHHDMTRMIPNLKNAFIDHVKITSYSAPAGPYHIIAPENQGLNTVSAPYLGRKVMAVLSAKESTTCMEAYSASTKANHPLFSNLMGADFEGLGKAILGSGDRIKVVKTGLIGLYLAHKSSKTNTVLTEEGGFYLINKDEAKRICTKVEGLIRDLGVVDLTNLTLELRKQDGTALKNDSFADPISINMEIGVVFLNNEYREKRDKEKMVMLSDM